MCFECNDLLAYTRVGKCCSGSTNSVETRRCLEVCSIPAVSADKLQVRVCGSCLWCLCELRWFDQESYEWIWAGGHNALEECLVTQTMTQDR